MTTKDLSAMIDDAVRAWAAKGRADYVSECRHLLEREGDMSRAAANDRVSSWIYGDFKTEMRTQGPRSRVMSDILDAVWEHLDVDAIAEEIVDDAIATARAEQEGALLDVIAGGAK